MKPVKRRLGADDVGLASLAAVSARLVCREQVLSCAWLCCLVWSADTKDAFAGAMFP